MESKQIQSASHEITPHGAVSYEHDIPMKPHQPGQSVIPRNGPMRLKGYRHIFDPWTTAKWGFPNFYRKPSLAYQKLAQHRHRDIFDREWTGDYDDRYISSWDGRASKLVVQAVDEIYENNVTSTYRRTFIRNIAPLYMRLANWPFNHIDFHKSGGNIPSDDLPMLCLKWFVASCVITFVISSPTSATGQARNGGAYDPVPYQYFGYPKVARNAHENPHYKPSDLSKVNPVSERLLRPRYLCFLREHGEPAMIMNVEEWITQYKSERNLSYVFVAYTAEQFRTQDDLIALHQIADAAARNAGVMAYWIGCSCMPDPDQMQEDVYRICDVIRGASSLAIAVGQPAQNIHGISTTDEMLQQWGTRIWTFPEVLLAPSGKDIAVFTRGMDYMNPIRIPKNQFAAKVWKGDAAVARQLIDHYEGSLILSQLELVTLALECLHKRETTQYMRGDHSYALMGLLRVRPTIDPTDSAFQAFARLSLANGSDQLLERLICIMPRDPNQPWHSMDDAWGSKLWDILPQDVGVAGVGEDDSIILDGCRAANVRWKSFTPVAHVRRQSWKRAIASLMLRISGIVFIIAVALVASSQASRAIGAVLLIYALIMMALSPWLLRMLYLGKFWDQQCWLFGFEGYMDIDQIEYQIFGGRLGRMKWTAAASPLSRHHRNEHGECVPDDPTSDPNVAALVQRAKTAGPGDQRIFTIVDTGNMTATLISAERPPVCFIKAGSEGGMMRLIGCSYDWTTATFYRETVLRMGTQFDDSMRRMARAKIGFKRTQHPVGLLAQIGEAQGHQTA